MSSYRRTVIVQSYICTGVLVLGVLLVDTLQPFILPKGQVPSFWCRTLAFILSTLLFVLSNYYGHNMKVNTKKLETIYWYLGVLTAVLLMLGIFFQGTALEAVIFLASVLFWAFGVIMPNIRLMFWVKDHPIYYNVISLFFFYLFLYAMVLTVVLCLW